MHKMNWKLPVKRIIWNIFPPESRTEVFLRTMYHRIQAISLVNFWQRARAAKSYLVWRTQQSINPPFNNLLLPNYPKVTFLLYIELSQVELAIATLQSIRAFKIRQWEILLLYKGGIAPVFPESIKTDDRITLVNTDHLGTTELYSMVTGQFFIHCQPGDLFFFGLLEYFYQAHETTPSADLYYYDCEIPIKGPTKYQPFFKPAANSPELLLSVNYLSRAFIRAEKAIRVSTQIEATNGLSYLDLELILRLIEGQAVTCHIPRVLVTQFNLSTYSQETSRELVCEHLSRVGLTDVHFENSQQGSRLTWQKVYPSVSIIIPSKNNLALISHLIESILTITDYPNYTISIIDNASYHSEVSSYYRKLEKDRNIQLIHYDKPFNYSEAINLGVASTESELVLLMNNDMKVIDSWWLQDLTQWAVQPEIGVVGGKLLRINHTIQHTGIIVGLNGFMGHLYLNAPEHYTGLLGSADWYRNFSAVTGACQMVRRELFERVGRYDEKYRLVFGDIDFCLRIHEMGYRNMITPFARLYHLEGESRGFMSPVDDILRGYENMHRWIAVDDPYFSPNLTYTPIPECQLTENSIDKRLENIELRRKSLQRMRPEKG